jgi:hypothetical protein
MWHRRGGADADSVLSVEVVQRWCRCRQCAECRGTVVVQVLKRKGQRCRCGTDSVQRRRWCRGDAEMVQVQRRWCRGGCRCRGTEVVRVQRCRGGAPEEVQVKVVVQRRCKGGGAKVVQRWLWRGGVKVQGAEEVQRWCRVVRGGPEQLVAERHLGCSSNGANMLYN